MVQQTNDNSLPAVDMVQPVYSDHEADMPCDKMESLHRYEAIGSIAGADDPDEPAAACYVLFVVAAVEPTDWPQMATSRHRDYAVAVTADSENL